ncbi:MAG TPA: Coenzyme F420 hydrogenase/dehydrogenase, beta subunit C-terminal domain [Candidatus Lokiarchaeia archaeon]|nr:Coenzyme F420 hydrogenase/dehydrogenase, beta subunit C-terminal domain [Candidatus Lokiarchaeia archaeon]
MEIGKAYKATAKTELPPVESLLKIMLEQQMVEKVLGARIDKDITQVKPEAIDNPENIQDMNFTSYVAFNFAKMDSASKFVHKSMGAGLIYKVGMFARPCDVRALVELHKRRQVNLDNLVIIGIEEYGQIDQKNLKKFFTANGIDPASIQGVTMSADKITMIINGEMQEFPFDETIGICHNCSNCRNKMVHNADITASFLTDTVILTPQSRKGLDIMEAAKDMLDYVETSFDSRSILKPLEDKGRTKQLEEIEEFKAKSPSEKMSALGECTACGICIRSCPVCFCVDCALMNKRKEKKIDQYTYQLSRIAHVADTCVQCGKCDSNCPKNLPLNVYFNEIALDMEKKYGYVTGRSIKDIPPRADINAMRTRYQKH